MSLELNPFWLHFEQAKPEIILPGKCGPASLGTHYDPSEQIPHQNKTLLSNAFVVTVSTCKLHIHVEQKKLKAFDTGIVIALVIPSR